MSSRTSFLVCGAVVLLLGTAALLSPARADTLTFGSGPVLGGGTQAAGEAAGSLSRPRSSIRGTVRDSDYEREPTGGHLAAPAELRPVAGSPGVSRALGAILSPNITLLLVILG